MYLRALTHGTVDYTRAKSLLMRPLATRWRNSTSFPPFLACFSIRQHCVTLCWCQDCGIGIYKYACACVVVLPFVLALLEGTK